MLAIKSSVDGGFKPTHPPSLLIFKIGKVIKGALLKFQALVKHDLWKNLVKERKYIFK